MSDLLKTAVIGHPIGHSKSPLIHNTWIQQYRLNGSYEAIDIPPEELTMRVQKMIEQGYAGFNVTVPHKEAMLWLCDEVDEAAQKIGAVNTVKIKDDKLYGYNTDAFGFAENIRDAFPEFDFAHGPAYVIGAGGAARAVIYALMREGVSEIIITNRTKARAQELRDHFSTVSFRIKDWDSRDEGVKDAALLVNTTSLGMSGQSPLELSLEELPESAVVNDIVYAPLETDLMRGAREKGCRVVSGIGMLLHQARPAFELWYGTMPGVSEDLARKVLS